MGEALFLGGQELNIFTFGASVPEIPLWRLHSKYLASSLTGPQVVSSYGFLDPSSRFCCDKHGGQKAAWGKNAFISASASVAFIAEGNQGIRAGTMLV